MTAIGRFAPFVGRVLLAFLFLSSGLGKIATIPQTTAYVAAAGLPAPQITLFASMALEILGGLSLLLGWKVRAGALILILFTVLAAIFFHNNFADQNQIAHFFKNWAIVGGLLQIVWFGAGPISLDNRNQTGAGG